MPTLYMCILRDDLSRIAPAEQGSWRNLSRVGRARRRRASRDVDQGVAERGILLGLGLVETPTRVLVT